MNDTLGLGGMDGMANMAGIDGMAMSGQSGEGEGGGIDPRRLWGDEYGSGETQGDGGNGMYCE